MKKIVFIVLAFFLIPICEAKSPACPSVDSIKAKWSINDTEVRKRPTSVIFISQPQVYDNKDVKWEVVVRVLERSIEQARDTAVEGIQTIFFNSTSTGPKGRTICVYGTNYVNMTVVALQTYP